MRGFWQMHCWNGLSVTQQRHLIEQGYLPIGYTADGTCERPATVCIETQWDEADGPRFYCTPCAIDYLKERERNGIQPDARQVGEPEPTRTITDRR